MTDYEMEKICENCISGDCRTCQVMAQWWETNKFKKR